MIEVENLSKRYGEKLAVAGLDLVVQPQPRAARRRTEPVPTRLIADSRRCQALFASGLQRSDAPGADGVAEAIKTTVRQFGVGGCASRMAQEFGDHPEAAAERMRWVRSLLGLTRS
jgi:hypothetical protein